MPLATQAGTEDVKAFVLRVPAQLRQQIVDEARKNHRTISGEIRMRLERDLSRQQSDSNGGAAA